MFVCAIGGNFFLKKHIPCISCNFIIRNKCERYCTKYISYSEDKHIFCAYTHLRTHGQTYNFILYTHTHIFTFIDLNADTIYIYCIAFLGKCMPQKINPKPMNQNKPVSRLILCFSFPCRLCAHARA